MDYTDTYMHSAISRSRGFTLIELLVVIAIIGVLSAVILASLNIARAKGNDARRLSDMHELQKALEFYYDANNAYPNTGGGWWANCSSWGSHGTSGANGWIPNLAPTYVPVLPLDPKPIPPTYCYLYRSDGVDYMLLVNLTVETYTATNNKWLRPSFPSHASFAFYTPGAASW